MFIARVGVRILPETLLGPAFNESDGVRAQVPAAEARGQRFAALGRPRVAGRRRSRDAPCRCGGHGEREGAHSYDSM